MEKINRSYVRKAHYIVQWSIFLMITYSGIRFYLYSTALEQGQIPSMVRPPSVEGFMPIGALMAFKLWITDGIFDPAHPAALIIFIGALILAFLLKKSFCSWICPVGALSDAAWKAGRKIFGKNLVIIKYIDYPLRSLKYLLMAFFLYIILVKMSSAEIIVFLDTPYWKVADMKLLKFFTGMSIITEITLGILLGLSLLYKNFWCRYLCPYGGLLGLLSMLSPVKITRTEKCIQCGLCSKNCPSLLPVDRKKTIRTPECTGCLTCVSYCPAKDALDASIVNKKALQPPAFIAAVLIIFFSLILAARLTGHWHSSVSNEELLRLTPIIKHLEHP